VALSERTGAAPAGVLDRVAASLRADAAAAAARDAALAAPRATARLLLALPAAGLVLGRVAGAHPVAVLVGTVPGRWCAGAGLVLAGVGWFWVHVLVKGAEAAR
jgi:tight adherence protein B